MIIRGQDVHQFTVKGLGLMAKEGRGCDAKEKRGRMRVKVTNERKLCFEKRK